MTNKWTLKNKTRRKRTKTRKMRNKTKISKEGGDGSNEKRKKSVGIG